MNRLLQALGLMRVSEHERLIEVARDEEQQTIDSLKAQLSATGRDHVNLLAKFKKAITDLAAAREEVEAYEKELSFSFDGPCPICNGVEGCSHSRGERIRAAIAHSAATEDVYEALNNANLWVEHLSAEADALRPDALAMRRKRERDRDRRKGKV